MKLLKRTLLVFLGLFVTIALSLAVACYLIVTPQRITPLVLDFTDKELQAEVKFEQLDISFFRSFPEVSLVIHKGYVADSGDTLVAFRHFELVFNPLSYLRKQRINISKIAVNAPRIYAFTNADGKNDRSLFQGDSSTFDIRGINVREFRITNGHIIYEDSLHQQLLVLDNLNLELSGRMGKHRARLKAVLDIGGISFWSEGQQRCPRLPLHLTAKLQQLVEEKQLVIQQAAFSIAGVEFNTNGLLHWEDSLGGLDINSKFELKTACITEVLEKLPSRLLKLPPDLHAEGAIAVNGSLNGRFSDKEFPVLEANIQVSGGKIRSKKYMHQSGIEQLELDGSTYIDINKKSPSTFQLKKLLVQTASSTLQLSGNAKHLFTDPLVHAKLNAHINFERLANDLGLTDSIAMKGLIRADIDGNFRLSHLQNRDLGQLHLRGELEIDSVYINDPRKQLSVSAPLLRAKLGANIKDSVRGRLRESLLRGQITANKLQLKFEDITGSINKLSLMLNTSAPADSVSVAPLFANLRAEDIKLNKSDSLQVKTRQASGFIRISPLPADKSKPLYTARFSLDSIRMRTDALFVSMEKGKISAKANERLRSISRRPPMATTANAATGTVKRRQDTIAGMPAAPRRQWRDTIYRSQQDDVLAMRLESREARDVLQQWEINGDLECNAVRIRTPYFPLRTRIKDGAVHFTTDSLILKDLSLRAGKSDMQLSGAVSGIRQALLRNGKITGTLRIKSDTLDINELTLALVSASRFSALKDSSKKQHTDNLHENDARLIEDNGQAGLFVIPRNIDFTLHTDIRHAHYAQIDIRHINSDLFVHNHTLEIPDMEMQSSVGDMRLSLAYQAAHTKGAHVGLDMHLKQIQVKELITAFPVFDSLTPMLRSFEGVVNCTITALTDLDSLTNVLLPTASASCLINGKDLVLMDGETFSELAKALHFKNKNRNLIDSISVDLIMENEHLLIFPFLLNLDRYQCAVGGTQRLDKSFDYHITVLQSPIPFKFGLNVIGQLDDYKIRLAKAKYKELFKPVKSEPLENLQLNVREELQRKLRTSIKNIVNTTPPSAQRPYRLTRQKSHTLNSLQQYFITDQTEVVTDTTNVDTDAITGAK